MRTPLLILSLLLSMGAFAQSEGDTKDIDGQIFKYQNARWVHGALGSSYSTTAAFSAVYKDKTWKKWYDNGDPTLKKIMDLGPEVDFKYKGDDAAFHTYSVTKAKAAAAASGGRKILGMTPKTAALVGGAVIAGVILIDENNGNGDKSGNKR